MACPRGLSHPFPNSHCRRLQRQARWQVPLTLYSLAQVSPTPRNMAMNRLIQTIYVQSRCSRFACKDSTGRKMTNDYASLSKRCGRITVSETESCEATGYVSHFLEISQLLTLLVGDFCQGDTGLCWVSEASTHHRARFITVCPKFLYRSVWSGQN